MLSQKQNDKNSTTSFNCISSLIDDFKNSSLYF